MSLPEIVSHEEWLAARKALLEKEKELTRAPRRAERRAPPPADGRDRQGLPLRRARRARSALLDLFEGRLQLIIGHFMFDPEWEDGCPSCSAGADEIARRAARAPRTSATPRSPYVSRAPLAKLERYKAKKGWTFPWYSSYGSDFNYDFDVTLDARVKPLRVQLPRARTSCADVASRTPSSRSTCPGTSCFLRDGDRVFHTYSSYARGRGVDRRLVLLPRPHGARAPGGLGGAEGPRRPRARATSPTSRARPRSRRPPRRRAGRSPGSRARGGRARAGCRRRVAHCGRRGPR